MQNKFTPAPWRISPINSLQVVSNHKSHRYAMIADCGSGNANRIEWDKANAKLISAAPDMLEYILCDEEYSRIGGFESDGKSFAGMAAQRKLNEMRTEIINHLGK